MRTDSVIACTLTAILFCGMASGALLYQERFTGKTGTTAADFGWGEWGDGVASSEPVVIDDTTHGEVFKMDYIPGTPWNEGVDIDIGTYMAAASESLTVECDMTIMDSTGPEGWVFSIKDAGYGNIAYCLVDIPTPAPGSDYVRWLSPTTGWQDTTVAWAYGTRVHLTMTYTISSQEVYVELNCGEWSTTYTYTGGAFRFIHCGSSNGPKTYLDNLVIYSDGVGIVSGGPVTLYSEDFTGRTGQTASNFTAASWSDYGVPLPSVVNNPTFGEIYHAYFINPPIDHAGADLDMTSYVDAAPISFTMDVDWIQFTGGWDGGWIGLRRVNNAAYAGRFYYDYDYANPVIRTHFAGYGETTVPRVLSSPYHCTFKYTRRGGLLDMELTGSSVTWTTNFTGVAEELLGEFFFQASNSSQFAIDNLLIRADWQAISGSLILVK